MNGRPDLPAVGRGAKIPGAEVAAPSFDDEIDVAISFEKHLAGKTVLALALVLLVLGIRAYFG
jgi:hypothetical protein